MDIWPRWVFFVNDDEAVENEVNLGDGNVMRRHLNPISASLAHASPSSRRLLSIAAALASLGVGCGDLRGAPEDGGIAGSDAATTDAGPDVNAPPGSDDAGPDATLLDGNAPDDASTRADAADSSPVFFDAGIDATA